jgi:single-stranded-DNA-specific exonuclease
VTVMDFAEHLNTGAAFFRKHFRQDETTFIVHHNDADGLSSASLMSKTIEFLGGRSRRICLEKPYPKVVEHIHNMDSSLMVYLDFGSGSAELISQKNDQKRPVLILDHHLPVAVEDPMLFSVNPMFCGIRGDKHITASGVTYLFCRLLTHRIEDYVHLALLGAIGDSHDRDGVLTSFNQKFLKHAINKGLITQTEGVIRDYEVRGFVSNGERVSLAKLSRDVTTLGAVGYLEGGVDQGFELCLSGYSQVIEDSLANLMALKQERFSEFEKRLQKGELQQGKYIQWFDVKDGFYPLGVKMVGVFCSSIKNRPWVNPDLYLAGFQEVPNVVPGLGPMELHSTKISMRIPRPLEIRMFAGEAQSLLDFLPEATVRLGGFVDGCHSYAAATTVDLGLETALIMEMEKVLEENLAGR